MSGGDAIIYQEKPILSGLTFDPRTKILLLVEMDTLLFMGSTLAYESAVFLLCALILLIGGQSRSSLKFTMVYLAFVITGRFISPFAENGLVSLLYFLVVVIRKILPALMIAKWLVATTPVSSFVAAMRKCHFPDNAIITSSVIFRCFPTIREEWTSIQMAMKMRGISFNFKNLVSKPVQTVTHMLVPLFISALNISDELAAAALCRGLDNPGKHTALEQIRFRWNDILLLSVISLWLAIMCFIRIRGYDL